MTPGWVRSAAAVALVACAPGDAGFGAVRTTVAERTGARIRRGDGGATFSPEVLRLLSRPLTADSAAQVALLNNRTLQATFEDLGLARADLVGASRLPNPRVEADYRFRDRLHDAEYQFAAVESIIDLLLVPARRSVASARLEAEKRRVAVQAIGLAFDARRAFYACQAAGQVTELQRSALESAAAGYQTAQELRQAGNISELELSMEQARYEEARLELSDAEEQEFESRERLQVLLGLWGRQTSWTVATRLADPREPEEDVGEPERRAIERSLELAEARARILAAAREVGLARTEGLIPELSAGVEVEHETDGTHGGPALALTLPLFDQGQGRTERAEAGLRRLQAQYVALAVEVRSAARSRARHVLAARQRGLYYRSVLLPLRARVLEQTQLQYNAMQVGVFQLLQARRDQVQVARGYVDALRRYWVARADFGELLAGRMGPSRASELGAAPPESPTELERSRGGH